jgi:preprotein translocase subunit SecF
MKLFAFAENANYNFVGQRYIAFFITAVMILGSVYLFAAKGLNYGIDFTGGIMMEVRTPSEPDLTKIRSGLENLNLGAISIQEFGDKTDFMIRVPQQKGGAKEQQEAIASVKTVLDSTVSEGQKIEYRRSEFVGPQVGDELKFNATLAFVLTIFAILAYVWVRFEWQYGVSAIICLIHDTTAVVGLFALLGMQFDLAALAAVLMVAGYSCNDTVIVFDRIRENRRKFKKMPIIELINKSTNQTLSRTLMTSLTTILALVALWIFGGAVIRDFVIAMLFGVVVGTYSSIYVASSALIYLPFKGDEKRDDDATKDA